MSESEFVREIIRIRLYGLEHVQRIAAARLEAVAGKGPRQGPQGGGFHDLQRRAACAEFTRLINARSPDRVARMEAERGL